MRPGRHKSSDRQRAWGAPSFPGIAIAIACALLAGAGIAGPRVAEPEDYRTDNYRAPVPATLRGARVIGADEARQLRDTRGAIFIDVYPRPVKPDNLPPGTLWRQPGHSTIDGGVWLPNVGYGVLAPSVEEYFRTRLERLTKANRDATIVFYCQRDCWMSWNAAKRALTYGYRNVLWFPEGTDGWQDSGFENLVPVEPVP